MKIKNLIGNRFGRLVVIEQSGKDSMGRAIWLCKCDCGENKAVRSRNLIQKMTVSCGCYNREATKNRLVTHGQAGKAYRTVEYATWASIKSRCYNPNNQDYKNYGGRGIIVCDRWLNSFENFFIDMGLRPSEKMSIDRIDSNKEYSLENCRWGTDELQARNKTNNHTLSYDGETMILEDWAKTLKVSNGAIRYHLNKGKDFNYIYNYFNNGDN